MSLGMRKHYYNVLNLGQEIVETLESDQIDAAEVQIVGFEADNLNNFRSNTLKQVPAIKFTEIVSNKMEGNVLNFSRIQKNAKESLRNVN